MRVSSKWIALTVLGLLSCPVPGRAQAELTIPLSRLPELVGHPTTYQRTGDEDLFQIARAHGVSASMVNNANSGSLRGGDELLVLPTQHVAPLAAANGIVINLPERNLYLYRNGHVVKVYPIAIGMTDWRTPTGSFRIAEKRVNPTWFPPKWAEAEKPVPPGPDNPLGDRWMGLSIHGYGLHATNAPMTIGRFASHGCMRMYPEHAHELFNTVSIGTPVKIIYQLVSLGYDPRTGIVYLAHHPDPYEHGDPTVGQVRNLLARYGLADVADLEAIAKALEKPRGIPIPVVGSEVKVTVDGGPVHFALAPISAGTDWLVPASTLAQALGGRAGIGLGGNAALLSRGGFRIAYARNGDTAVVNGTQVRLETPMRTVLGCPLVPIRATATALGATVNWDPDGKTISISDSRVPSQFQSARAGEGS